MSIEYLLQLHLTKYICSFVKWMLFVYFCYSHIKKHYQKKPIFFSLTHIVRSFLKFISIYVSTVEERVAEDKKVKN